MADNFSVAQAICDHAVLQRNADTRIWGKGTYENQKINLTLGEYKTYAYVDCENRWVAYFHNMKETTTPLVLKIESDGQTVEFSDILIGEVFLVTGQSNAEITFKFDEQCLEYHRKTLEEADEKDNIRAIVQHREDIIRAGFAETTYPHEDFLNPAVSAWRVCKDFDSTVSVSLIGYYFAKYFGEATGIPVGIVMAACCSSPLLELLPRELCDAYDFKNFRNTIDASGAYNTLIAPVINMTYSGILFYQGESEQNNPRYKSYDFMLAAFVAELRRRMNRNVPFYYVQLSSHPKPEISLWHYHNITRNTQFAALRLIPNSGMVVSRDAGWRQGDLNMYHPFRKEIVSKRLCDLALSDSFGILNRDYVTSPEPSQTKFYPDRVEIKFAHVADGLCLYSGDELLGFEISSDGESFTEASAKIVSKDTVIVTGAENPKVVRFGFEYLAYPEIANLYNSSKLPAPCFELVKDKI